MAIDPNSSSTAATRPPPPPLPQPPPPSTTRPPPPSTTRPPQPTASPLMNHPVPIPNSSNPAWAHYSASGFPRPAAAHAARSPSPQTKLYAPPPQQQHHFGHPHPFPAKAVPVSNSQPLKVASPSVPESNGYKDTREKGNEIFAPIRDRRVRIIEGRSLYAHCRSWLRNGFPEDVQPQYGNAMRSLPKPSPIPMATPNPQKKGVEEEKVVDDAEEGEDIENLSTEDLFKRHVKRAKKVRARLREVRLKRIARYKSRLALLLPPLVEQFRSDTPASGT